MSSLTQAEAVGWMLGSALAFACMGATAHALGQTCSWQTVACIRTTVALVLSLLWAWQRGTRLVVFTPATLWIRSLSGSLALLCTFYALVQLPISEAITLTNMTPLWIALFSWPVYGEPPPLSVWVAIALGLMGVVLIQSPHWSSGNWAGLVAVGGSMAAAVAMLGLHQLRGVSHLAVVVHFSAVSMVVTVLFLSLTVGTRPGEGLFPSVFDIRTLLLFLGVGLTATLGQITMTRAYSLAPPSRVAVAGLTQVVFSSLLDMIFWQRAFASLTLLGMALIIAPTGWLLVEKMRRRLVVNEVSQ